MAHLGGKGGARRHIESGGAYDPADSNGTKLSDYAKRFGGMSVGGATTTTSSMNGPLVRTADGSLEGRLFGPLSGPILQAHDAAAGVAFQAGKINDGITDMMQLSTQLQNDPEGFREAAAGYIDAAVQEAPRQFRQDLRASLEREAQRRFLGVVEDRQRETRQRAANASGALVDRWSDNLASAIASGNAEEIATAEAELRGLLSARETLPGLSWTPEQSENVILGARKRADEITARQRRAVSDERKGQLQTIIKAAKEGLTSAFENLLTDPDTAAMHPELMQEAQAFATLRASMPSFYGASRSQRSATIADLEGQPVAEDWQIDLLKAVRATDREITQAFDKDPVAAAQTYLPQKPPEIAMDDPTAMVPALMARREYMNGLVESGHVAEPAFLSAEEGKALSAMASPDAPPEARAALAAAIVQGFGPDAGRVFGALNADPVFRVGGALAGRGGDPATVAAAFQGAALLRAGQVRLTAQPMIAIDSEIASAFAVVPGAPALAGDVMETARAIAASRLGPNPTDEETKAAMRGALQAALGQSRDPGGRVTGGVQTIGGNPVYLPIGVSGDRVEAAMRAAFAVPTTSQAFGMISPFSSDPRTALPDVWGAAGVGTSKGGVPLLGGQPMTAKPWLRGDVRLKPMGAHVYTMEIENAGGGIQVPRDASGNAFMFDIRALLNQ